MPHRTVSYLTSTSPLTRQSSLSTVSPSVVRHRVSPFKKQNFVPDVVVSPVATPIDTPAPTPAFESNSPLDEPDILSGPPGTVDIITHTHTDNTHDDNHSMDFGTFDLPSIGGFPINTRQRSSSSGTATRVSPPTRTTTAPTGSDSSEVTTEIIRSTELVSSERSNSEEGIEMISRAEADLLANRRVVEALAHERAEVARQHADEINAYAGRLSPLQPSRQTPIDQPTVERSMSTSRLARLSGLVRPQPSTSMPAHQHGRTLKSSTSMISLRSESSRKDSISKRHPDSIESKSGSSSYGSVRIMEHRKYQPNHYLASSTSIGDHSRPSKQIQKTRSTASLSTMSSDDVVERMVHKPMSDATNSNDPGTDIDVISAITRTMIGEWMWKHTRRHVGGGISENKHKRFFWVHPYTRTLYWSATEPGVDNNEAKAKSAFIEAVTSVPSRDQANCSPMSLLIKTTKRDLKLTAPTIDLHDLWLMSLSYLLVRPGSQEDSGASMMEESSMDDGHRSQHSLAGEDSDDSEDLVNIRSCCDGKHDLSTLRRDSHNHHHQ
ncbi:meiotic cell cortex C-terminal pleckstrin homology-domain-containing protein, partial [Phycomyces blakesleeanus]